MFSSSSVLRNRSSGMGGGRLCEMADKRCMACGNTGELKAIETYAGSCHGSCSHLVCKTCLEASITAQLPECKSSWQLSIACPVKDCKRRLPQKLVLDVSDRARDLAGWIDRGNTWPPGFQCPCCGESGQRIVVNADCGHGACTKCWTADFDNKLANCRETFAVDIPCCHAGCSQGCKALIRSLPDITTEALAELETLEADIERTYCRAWRGPPVGPGPTCPICQEACTALLFNADCSEEHRACEKCWARWAEEQYDDCVAHRRFPNKCLWPRCSTETSQDALFWRVCQPSYSTRLQKLVKDLNHRRRLERNPLYPPAVQVNCPQPSCVGLGYLGYDTVMCFCCEHQWFPGDGVEEKPRIPDTECIMGVEVKKCPKCDEYIEKNGGCDHMTCKCGHEFSWTTLKPWSM